MVMALKMEVETQQKDAAIVDIQLQRTLNSVPNAAGGCNVFHVLNKIIDVCC